MTKNVTDVDAAYRAALQLIERIETGLDRGTVHYRDRRGRLLLKLDQVVRSILSDDLALSLPEGESR